MNILIYLVEKYNIEKIENIFDFFIRKNNFTEDNR